jgi:hypothetical protein
MLFIQGIFMLKENIFKLICLSFVILCSAKNESIATQEASATADALAKSNNLITKAKAKQLIDLINLGYKDAKWYHKVNTYDNNSLRFEVSLDFPDMQVILELSGKINKDFKKKTAGDVAKGHFNRFNPFNDEQHQSWEPYLVGIESFSLPKHSGNSEGLKMTFRQNIAKNSVYDVIGKFRILSVRYNFKDKEHKHINKDVSSFLFGNPELLNYINVREENHRKASEEKQALELRRQQNANKYEVRNYADAQKTSTDNKSYSDDQGGYNNCEGLTGYALRDCEDSQGGYAEVQNNYRNSEEDYYGYSRQADRRGRVN